MKQQNIGFIGGGNMAWSLISGLLADGYEPAHIAVADVDAARLELLKSRLGVTVAHDNVNVVAESEIVVLAVKPQVMRPVATGIAAAVHDRQPLIVSIAAGVRVTDLATWLGGDAAIVRCMPNTPAQVRSGATALYANERASREQRNTAERILRSVGLTVWVEEERLLDAVTALSGSGPAYFFLFMEAMERAAASCGLDAHVARLLTQQTALGAAKIAMESAESPEELRRRVTSPGGTTEQAIRVFEEGRFADLVLEAIRAAERRSRELSEQFGGG
ncbi:MAG TPA: pyrroline-5-carboxylate reductase [Methylococcaceae bacterium]|nr:pyrroline-5-carboxylate reductase [Methylococcaceae bacterium]